jgi:hypothetical protein
MRLGALRFGKPGFAIALDEEHLFSFEPFHNGHELWKSDVGSNRQAHTGEIEKAVQRHGSLTVQSLKAVRKLSAT